MSDEIERSSKVHWDHVNAWLARGGFKTDWKVAMRRMVEARHPDWLV